eukprot:evm.model.NODE_12758_length_23644_cov_37.510574.8
MSDSGDEVEVKRSTGEEKEEVDQSLANSDVTTKYQEAAKIANAVLEAMLAQVEPGVNPVDICRAGDEMIEEKCKKIFTKKVKGQAIEKGVAFPTCPAPTAEAPITGPTADVFLAALTAAEAATKLIKAGNTNQQVTDAVAKVAEAYGVNAMQGTLMHQMKR